MRHKTIAAGLCAAVLVLCLTSCTERKHLDDLVYETAVTSENCYLCGDGSPLAPLWGQANIGLLNMNTMEYEVLEMNRYSDTGELIETVLRHGTQNSFFGDSEQGSRVSVSINQNRGYLTFTASFKENSAVDIAIMEQHYCTDCLSGIINQYTYDELHWDIAIIDFAGQAIRPLQNDHTIAQHLSDYRVSYEYGVGYDISVKRIGWIGLEQKKEYEKMSVTAFYCPIRYTEFGYDPTATVLEQIMEYCADYNIDFTPDSEVKDYLSRFDSITCVSYSGSGQYIRFQEWFNGSKELLIHSDGTYDIIDFEWTDGGS